MSDRKNLVRVVVIEDNPDDQELLERQLRKAHMSEHVKFIADGKEAVNFFEQDPEELARTLMVIFLDLKLPGLGGLEVLKRLKAMKSVSKIPVIVMTSSNDPVDMNECKRLAVVNYVEKPVTFTCFTKAMADVFQTPSVERPPMSFGSDR